MDYPTGWDKLNAVWIDQSYNLALAVSTMDHLPCAPSNDLQDVFESSIASFQAGGFNYDGKKAVDRAQDALTRGWAK